MRKLPLENIRVLDFTLALAGPLVTLWLASLGAEVYKVESRTRLDISRRMRVDETGNMILTGDPRTGFYEQPNHSKKSITVDLSKPGGVAAVRELAKVCDVVVESFAPGVMDRLGVGYKDIRRVRPDVVYFSLSGFGQTGPYSRYRAFGHIASSFGGVDNLTGRASGRPASVGSTLDGVCSISGVLSIMMALWSRFETGQGQHADLAMSEVQMCMIPEAMMDYVMNGRVRHRDGNHDDVFAPYGTFRCEGDDAWIAIGITNDDEWRGLCQVMGRGELADDPRYADGVGRWKHRDELEQLIELWTCTRKPWDLFHALQRAGVPAGPAATTVDILNDPQVKARGMLTTVRTRQGVPVVLQRLPARFGGEYKDVPEPAPTFGEHNEYAFREVLGLPPAHVRAMVDKRILW